MTTSAPIYIQDLNAICSLGNGMTAIAAHLFTPNATDFGGMSEQYSVGKPLYLSGAPSTCALPADTPLAFHSRNNGLMYQTFQAIKESWHAATASCAPTRIGIVMGSSNSGIEQGELALAKLHATQVLPAGYLYEQQEYGSPALYLKYLLQTSGPAYTISTACSSSAKAFISGARLIQAGLCDVVLVGGSDALSRLTVNGFMSLEAISAARSLPFSANRSGIHLGEACALFILSRTPSAVELRGWGESADAHHMSAPQPDGNGAFASMSQALHKAGLDASQIDYINLHGTATAQNDAMEAAAVSRVFPSQPWTGSTKSLTGHTLGAAGAIEAAFCYLTLTAQNQRLPAHVWDGVRDSRLPELRFVTDATRAHARYALSNSFGFGGSNVSLIFARV